jgi:hypothetical protein
MTPCRRDRSTSRCSWSSPPFGTRRRSRLGYRFWHRCRFSRPASGSTETKLQCQRGSALRIAGRCHWMVTGEVPASAILLHGQSMAGSEMPPEHLAAPPAFEANNVIAMNRSPDRHCGSSLYLGFSRQFTEADERLMNGRDQSRELIGRDLVPPNIGGGDHRCKLSIGRYGRCFVGQFGSPCQDHQNTTRGKSRRRFRISIRYYAAPLTSFWFLPSKQPGLSSSNRSGR